MSTKNDVISLMKNSHITAKQISSCGIPENEINQWIKGNKKMGYFDLWKMCDFLNIDLSLESKQ